MSERDELKRVRCSFCNKTQEQVRKLIAGPDVYICDECVSLCGEIIQDALRDFSDDTTFKLPKPKEIKAFLDDYVIGQ